MTTEIRAIEGRIAALLQQYQDQPDRGPDLAAATRARIAALKADRADLKRLREDPGGEALRVEREVAGFAAALGRCGDVVGVMTARG